MTNQARFLSHATQQRLEKEDIYRKLMLDDLYARQRVRSHSEAFQQAAQDAENQLLLFGIILAQLARQENALQIQRTATKSSTSEELHRMRRDAADALWTIL